MAASATNIVSVPVPEHFLGQVYGFLSTLYDADAEGGASAADADSTEASVWTDDLLRRQFRESPDFIKAMQKLLAEHPGEWLSTSEVATRLDAAKGSRTVAGALGAFGRRTGNRYKMTTWPFRSIWNHEDGQCRYSMDADVAEVIAAL